jgi:hypothetical protein
VIADASTARRRPTSRPSGGAVRRQALGLLANARIGEQLSDFVARPGSLDDLRRERGVSGF